MSGRMQTDEVNLVILSGPVGVGKTTVADELSGLLEADGVSHTFIDLDGLSKTYPRPSGDKFGERIALKNLTDVWTNARELGVKTLILARVIETREGAERIAIAVGASTVCVVQLNASDSALLSRVRRREIGRARTWHEQRALELSMQLRGCGVADVELETDDKTATEIANEVRTHISFG
ncbi:MAG: KTI12 family protein [Hyphomonadaceae bacterium]|nr:KTI12 family protein [Hyphomonadaceae bacterium]